MVFRQLLPLAFFGTVRAQCNGHNVSMNENLASSINPSNVDTPVYWSCASSFAFPSSQDPVPFYYECLTATETATETLCVETQVYARVPNMPAGNNSYGAFGVRLAHHSDMYMWGRKQNNIVNQGWEVVEMSRASQHGRSFQLRDVSQVAFSNPVAHRQENGLLEIMFNLPGAISNYNFTAAVGDYGQHGHNTRVLRENHLNPHKKGFAAITTKPLQDAPLVGRNNLQGRQQNNAIRAGEACGTNFSNCAANTMCLKNSDNSACTGEHHTHRDDVCSCMNPQTTARQTQTSTFVITVSCLAALAGLILVVGSIHVWKKNHARRHAARRTNAAPSDSQSEVSTQISFTDKKHSNPLCESVSTSLV